MINLSIELCSFERTSKIDPVILSHAFIERTAQVVPSTCKYMNNYDQLEEELSHAHFENTENEQKLTVCTR